jgi:hypothetical protein
MSDCSETTSRIQKLRELRKSLCEKETAWTDTSKAKDWLISELCELKKLADKDSSTIYDLKCRIASMLSVLEDDSGEKNE